MSPRHTHTYRPALILTLTLPDDAGQYCVLQLWKCACRAGMDLASDVYQGDRLLNYEEAMRQYSAEQRRRRTRTVLK